MKTLVPYLVFSGNCQDALTFYRDTLGGDFTIQTFQELPESVSDDYKDKVMHAEFTSGGIYFMASDSMPDSPVIRGTMISLNINLSTDENPDSLFEKLSKEGIVMMPLEDTFWNARFGVLTDKFGITWMVNQSKPSN